MTYRTLEFPNGARFLTVPKLFDEVMALVKLNEPMRAALMRPEELDCAVLNSQAANLFHVPAGGEA